MATRNLGRRRDLRRSYKGGGGASGPCVVLRERQASRFGGGIALSLRRTRVQAPRAPVDETQFFNGLDGLSLPDMASNAAWSDGDRFGRPARKPMVMPPIT